MDVFEVQLVGSEAAVHQGGRPTQSTNPELRAQIDAFRWHYDNVVVVVRRRLSRSLPPSHSFLPSFIFSKKLPRNIYRQWYFVTYNYHDRKNV